MKFEMARYWFLSFLAVFFVAFTYSFSAFSSQDNPFTETYTEYDILTIGSLEQAAGKKPFQIERAYRYIHPKSKMLPIERIQIRAPSGHIIAYTPTRMKAVTYCPRISYCWVFMWKTVYPLPALFKFNPDPKSWAHEIRPVMKYSRSGYAGEGFQEVYDPVLGLFGLGLFLIRFYWYFLTLAFLSFLLCLQIVKFHESSLVRKGLILVLFTALQLFLKTWLPLNPYVITTLVILLFSIVGTVYIGLPDVLTVLTVMGTFLATCLWIAKLRKRAAGLVKADGGTM